MSVRDAQPSAPLRPIPIHLPRPPELDVLRFRMPLFFEKPTKSIPHFWNPALDFYSPPRDSDTKNVTDTPLKPNLIMKRSLPSSQPSSLTSSVTPPNTSSVTAMTVMKSLKRTQPSSATTVAAPYTSAYERHFPSNHESRMPVLTSKETLFPLIIGVPGSILGHPTHLTTESHQSISQGHIALQHALALAQSRALMERLASSNAHVPGESLAQQHQSHQHQRNHRNQQQHSQNPQQTPITQFQPSAPLSDRPINLQSALTVAQSRAILERVNTSQILSPVISIDNSVAQGYGRKIFPCPQCRYTTDRRNNLKRHMLTMHQTSSKMLECCGIYFNTKASLREHAMIFHYHGYTCYFCGRRFCRKALLKRHLSIHNGQKDFVCSLCDYATSHKSNLERHRKVHSRQDDGKEGGYGQDYHDDDTHNYHDDGKSNGSEAVSHEDISSDELSVCSDFDDDGDEEINVHSD